MSNAKTGRRKFLTQLTGCTLYAGMLAALPRTGIAEPPSPSLEPHPLTPAEWDLSWIDKLTGKNRVVFDSPDINDGTVFINTFVYLAGYREVYNATAADTQAVLVLRGNGFHMALDDAMWQKYHVAEMLKLNTANAKNPYLAQMAALRQSGAILLACNVAATYYAGEVAKRIGVDAGAVLNEFKGHLAPGVLLQPSGVFAAIRAQQAGCCFMKAA